MSSKKKVIIAIGVLLLIFFSMLVIKKVKLGRMTQDGVLVEEPNGTLEEGHQIYSDWGDGLRFKVFDERWCEKEIGESGKKIKEYGDFLCCICAVASTADYMYYTPNRMNTILSELNGYDKNGDINNSILQEVVRNVKLHDTINSELSDEEITRNPMEEDVVYDIIKVKKDGEFRWVVMEGLSEDGKHYQCMDPQEKEITYLSDYGNRVYVWYTMGGLQKEIDIDNKESVLKQRELRTEERNRIIKRVGLFLLIVFLLVLGKTARKRMGLRRYENGESSGGGSF